MFTGPDVFFYATMASIVLLNASNGIYQNSVWGLASDFPENYRFDSLNAVFNFSFPQQCHRTRQSNLRRRCVSRFDYLKNELVSCVYDNRSRHASKYSCTRSASGGGDILLQCRHTYIGCMPFLFAGVAEIGQRLRVVHFTYSQACSISSSSIMSAPRRSALMPSI